MPANAQAYVRRLEVLLEAPVQLIGVGEARDAAQARFGRRALLIAAAPVIAQNMPTVAPGASVKIPADAEERAQAGRQG